MTARGNARLLASAIAIIALQWLAPAHATEPKLELVTFKNGDVELHGFIYKPVGRGPFPAVLWNHGSEKKPGSVPELAQAYLAHGFVFLIPHRHGHGRSPGQYIGDLIDQAPTGERNERMVELQEVYNRDVVAAVEFLKQQPYVDPARIVMSGVSYGGIQTLLSAERGLGIRAFIPFAPGAMSWEHNPRIRDRLARSVRSAQAPVFLIQAANDFDLGPSNALGPELDRLPFPHQHKVYPAFGSSHEDGHYGFATKGADIWGPDVFAFIDQAFATEKR